MSSLKTSSYIEVVICDLFVHEAFSCFVFFVLEKAIHLQGPFMQIWPHVVGFHFEDKFRHCRKGG